MVVVALFVTCVLSVSGITVDGFRGLVVEGSCNVKNRFRNGNLKCLLKEHKNILPDVNTSMVFVLF